jgi:hypothetical protein
MPPEAAIDRTKTSNQAIATICGRRRRIAPARKNYGKQKNLLVKNVCSVQTRAVNWFYWQVPLASVPDASVIFPDGSIDAALNIVRGLSQHTY